MTPYDSQKYKALNKLGEWHLSQMVPHLFDSSVQRILATQ